MEKALQTTTFDTRDDANPEPQAAQVPSSAAVYRALIACGIFSRTNPDAVFTFSKQLAPERFSPSRVIDLHDNSDGRIYVIVSGKVKISLRRPDGCELVVAVRGPAEIFGAVRLFDPGSKQVRATTLTEVVAVPIERNQLLDWMAQHPEIRYQVLRLFARWAKARADALVEFAFADVEARLASRLLCLMKRFGRRDGDGVRIVHDLTLNDFSLMVGVAPEAICTTLLNLEARGLIRVEHNSILIPDVQALASVRAMDAWEVCCA